MIALPVFGVFRVLASVELDNQAPLTANKVDIVSADRLLPDEFEAAELPAAKACPQRELCRGEGAPQHSRTLGVEIFELSMTPERLFRLINEAKART